MAAASLAAMAATTAAFVQAAMALTDHTRAQFGCALPTIRATARDTAIELFILWDESPDHHIAPDRSMYLDRTLEYTSTNMHLFICIHPDAAGALVNIEIRAHARGYSTQRFHCSNVWPALIIVDNRELARVHRALAPIQPDPRTLVAYSGRRMRYCACALCDQPQLAYCSILVAACLLEVALIRALLR